MTGAQLPRVDPNEAAWNDEPVAVISIVLVGVVILVGVALVLTLDGDGLPDDTVDHGDLGLPDRPLTADDIAGLRFRIGFRGYRMEDVDAALDRLAESMRARGPAE